MEQTMTNSRELGSYLMETAVMEQHRQRKAVTLRVSPQTKQALDNLAQECGRSVNEVGRMILEHGVRECAEGMVEARSDVTRGTMEWAAAVAVLLGQDGVREYGPDDQEEASE